MRPSLPIIQKPLTIQNCELKNMSEVATAAFIVEKSYQIRKASEFVEGLHAPSRRNATILSNAKICAMFHQQRKQKLKNRFGYRHDYAYRRLVKMV